MFRRPSSCCSSSSCALRSLTLATALVCGYLVVGEVLPYSVLQSGRRSVVLKNWQAKEVALISALSFASLLLGRLGGVALDSTTLALRIFDAINVVPLLAATATTAWVRLSDNCPFRHGAGAGCAYLSLLLDNVGLVTARLARLDLGICLLLSSRGKSSWLFQATRLGFTESVPLHRAGGWWCAVQSALHSSAYLLFYFQEGGGLRGVWDYCFPVPLDKGEEGAGLNRLGLVNFFGLVAFVLVVVLGAFALNWVRRRHYDVFQRTHLPLGMLFVLFCCLHDLPILLFCAPGLADWYFGWRFEDTAARTMPTRARVLEGTSGPWVELTVEWSADHKVLETPESGQQAIREQWVAIRLPKQLGRSSHPFSIASLSSTGLSVLVSARGGDWTRQLARLASEVEEAVVSGPFPGTGKDTFGGAMDGGDGESGHRLLLVAGGTGISGWLPALDALSGSSGPPIRLAWLVQTEGDYLALAQRLPSRPSVRVTIFVTRPSDSNSTTTTTKRGQAEKMDRIATKGGMMGRSEGGSERGLFARDGGARGTPFPVVSLAAAIVGLVVQHFLWRGWLIDLLGWSRNGFVSYTLVYRTLPIVLIVGCMAATTALGSWVSGVWVLHRRKRRHNGWTSYQKIGSFYGEEQEEHQGDEECPPPAAAAAKEEEEEEEADRVLPSEGSRGTLHDVRFGRPDLAALVHETAAGLPSTVQEGKRGRLVVAACGPQKMVNEVERVVKAVRKLPSFEHVRLQFSGLDSRW